MPISFQNNVFKLLIWKKVIVKVLKNNKNLSGNQ